MIMSLLFCDDLFLLNDHLVPVSGHSFQYPENAKILYEVLRVMDGIFLFLEDHIDRMERTAQLANMALPMESDRIAALLHLLPAANACDEGNIRFEFVVTPERTDFLAGFIPHQYPAEKDYKKGVRVSILSAERSNPNAKIYQNGLRRQVQKIIDETGVYEVLLLDQKQCITEGSRSNLFCIRKGTLVTPPLEQVLPGITRKEIFQIARENRIPVIEERIHPADLAQMEAVFLTGTSPKILPISSVDGQPFPPDHPLMNRLMSLYDQRIQTYIDSCRI